MASTENLDALVALVQGNRWRLVCLGDPAQLPAVGRGGMFALWCERLPAHQLEEVRRFNDDWQAETTLALRLADGTSAFVGDRVATRRNVSRRPTPERRSATARTGP